MNDYSLDDLTHDSLLDPTTDEVIDGQRVCTYRIELPADLCGYQDGDDTETEIELLTTEAIGNVRELASDYCIPARWEARLLQGSIETDNDLTFEVKRYSAVIA